MNRLTVLLSRTNMIRLKKMEAKGQMIGFRFSYVALWIFSHTSSPVLRAAAFNDFLTFIHIMFLIISFTYSAAFRRRLSTNRHSDPSRVWLSSSSGCGQADDMYSCELALCFTKGEWQGQVGWRTNKKSNSEIFPTSVQNTAEWVERAAVWRLSNTVPSCSLREWFWGKDKNKQFCSRILNCHLPSYPELLDHM